MFDVLNKLPDRFMEARIGEMREVCPRPTLIELSGARSPAVFVSILLHGNEDAGLLAMQDFFRKTPPDQLPRDLLLFVGNVEACATSSRYLDHQIDFNRAWPGSELPAHPIQEMLAAVKELAVERGLFASIDIHNNTGQNPHYGCVCSCAPPQIYLASLFSHSIMYFTRPKGVQTQAFMQHCPAVTCECGKIGDVEGALEASEFLLRCMQHDSLQPPAVWQSEPQIYHTVARIKVQEHCSVAFDPGADVVLRRDIDSLNFVQLDAGELLGTLNKRLEDCFVVHDEHGRDVTGRFLRKSDEALVLGCSAMPSMLTQNLDVIRQDCLGYLMERLPSHHVAGAR